MRESQLLTCHECIMLAYNFEEHSLGKLMILLALNKLNQEEKTILEKSGAQCSEKAVFELVNELVRKLLSLPKVIV